MEKGIRRIGGNIMFICVAAGIIVAMSAGITKVITGCFPYTQCADAMTYRN